MAFYYVKLGGTATGDVSFATKQVGAWSAAASEYYNDIENCLTSSSISDGDFILVSNLHDFTNATTKIQYNFTTSITIISVDDTNRELELVGAVERTTYPNDVFFESVGAQAVTLHSMKISSADFVYVSDIYLKLRCIQTVLEPSGGARLQPQNGSHLEMVSSTVSTAPYISLYGGAHLLLDDLRWGNSTPPSYLIAASSKASHILVKNTDISAIISATTPILKASVNSKLELMNCKIGVNQKILHVDSTGGLEADVISCDNGSGYHYFYSWRFEGEVEESTGTYLHAKYDDINGYSALMNSSAHASIGAPLRFKLCEIPAQDLSVTDKTYRVNLLLDTDTVAALTDANFWVDVTHSDNDTLALGKSVSSRNTDILATGVELTASAEVWQGILPSNKKAYHVDVTLSAASLSNVTNDNVIIHVNLAVPNADVYVDTATQIGT